MYQSLFVVLLAEAEEGISLAPTQKAQLFMVAGFILLGWVLARRQMKMRKRVNREAKVANRELEKIRRQKDPVLPLSDAPAETQRWQAAMFDLQRELKAELDTRIGIVQSLMRQLDQRMETIAAMQDPNHVASDSEQAPVNPINQRVVTLSNLGHTAAEIANQTGIPIGEVEITLSASSR